MELSPRAIRAGLLPEDVEVFDRQFRAAMAAATDSLDLTGVLGLLGHWRLVAASSTDPEAHRAMLATAARLNAGENVVTVPWSEARTRLGL
jgi:hypothetical protein